MNRIEQKKKIGNDNNKKQETNCYSGTSSKLPVATTVDSTLLSRESYSTGS